MVQRKFLVLLLFIGLFSLAYVLASSQIYDAGEISSDLSVYSCYPSCTAYINFTVNSSSELAGEIFNVSVNNTPQDLAIEYEIYWYNSSDFVNQSANDTFVNESNYNLTSEVHQFMINISMSSALSTVWNVSFNINGSDYNLSVYLDSIALDSPATYNLTEVQTPSFNFTLYSHNETVQNCTLYMNLNNTGTWTSYAENSSVLNGSMTKLDASTLAEGNYTWKVRCNVSGDSALRWIYIDDVADPRISGLDVAESTTSAVVTWTTNEDTSSTINYGPSMALSEGTGTDTLSTSHSITLTDLLDETEYYYNITSCDAQNNCVTNGTYSFNTTEDTSSNSGTTGGGPTTPTTTTLYKVWPSLNENSTYSWKVSSSLTGINEINITTDGTASYARVTVIRYSSKPANVSIEKSNTYKYFAITTSNLQNLSEAVVTIQVNQTWADDEGLEKDDLSLFKFDNLTNEWYEIATSFLREDTNYYYYTAKLTSFSYFAIAGKTVVVPATTDTTTSTENSTDQTPAADSAGDSEGESSGSWVWTLVIIVAVIGLAAIAVAGYILYRQFFLKKKGLK